MITRQMHCIDSKVRANLANHDWAEISLVTKKNLIPDKNQYYRVAAWAIAVSLWHHIFLETSSLY